jgi:hypothetical protein
MYQILTVHTFTMAFWRVGGEARHFTVGIIALTWLFLVLWVAIGNGIHRNFEMPSPVHNSGLLIPVIYY